MARRVALETEECIPPQRPLSEEGWFVSEDLRIEKKRGQQRGIRNHQTWTWLLYDEKQSKNYEFEQQTTPNNLVLQSNLFNLIHSRNL